MSWRTDARRIASIALFTAAVTGAASAVIGASAWHVLGAFGYIAAAAVALLAPGALVVQVVGGLMLVGSLLLDRDWPTALLVLPLVAAVVVTAELIAFAARLSTPFDRSPGHDLRRAGIAAVIAGAVYGIVVLAGTLPGPTGVMAIALGSAACALLALGLAAER